MKDFIWVGCMPSICGYGILVLSKTEKDAKKELKKSYYAWRKAYGFQERGHISTFNKAMDYFGGWIEKRELNVAYDECLR